LLDQLMRDLPWDTERDKIVFLGDLIDRGPDGPGVIDRVMKLRGRNPNVVVLRGNHEQMLLDCLAFGDLQWLIPENGGVTTLKSYGMDPETLEEVSDIRIPDRHLTFLKALPYYHEDDQAIYVHAGLLVGQHPSRTDPNVLIWTRDLDFYRSYEGKLCFFGHTPTQFLPRDGRARRYGPYIHGACVGLDTSGDEESPLSCLRVESFTLYQAFPNGDTVVERLHSRKPAPSDGESLERDHPTRS
jgi:serine/threonine protein phosphatase 1